MKSKSSSSKKKELFIPYFSSSQNSPLQEESWASDDINISNNPTNSSWRANLLTEDLSIVVNTQLTTETPRTLKLSSQTIRKYSFHQLLIHTERTEAVNVITQSS